MSDRKFRVGIIGADTQASWAGASHVPALRAQPSLVLAAVTTRRKESAKAEAQARVSAATFGYGPQSPKAYDYFNKAASGASFMTITTGHVLNVIEAVLGTITEVDARTEFLWPAIEIVDTGETSMRDIPDHVDLIAKTESGASVLVLVLAGVPAEDANFVFEVRGSNGWLKLTGNHLAGVQVGDLALSASIDFAVPDAPVATGVGPTAAPFRAGAAINVGEVYASLGRDLVAGTFQTPGLEQALHNSRLVAAVERAAQTGERQRNLA